MTTSIWVDLLGADVRIVQGARYNSRVLEAGHEHPETLVLMPAAMSRASLAPQIVKPR